MKSFLNTTLRNVLWFKQAYDKQELEMKPPFQRNPVWVTRQKSFLIDSILNGFPIPEIYMQEVIEDSGKAKYIIVDGQQRIRAVLEYLEALFSMDEKDSPNWANMYFDELTGAEKKAIYEYNFVVRILPDMEESQTREIFQRLNKNVVALNKQELRQATYWGEFISLMNLLSDKEIWTKIDLFTPNDIRRMLDVEYISELTIAMLHGLQNKKQHLDRYYEIYEENFEQKAYVFDTFNSVLSEITKILPDISTTRWSKKTDFYSLFLLLAKYSGKLPFSKDERVTVRNKLVEFGEEIDNYLKTETVKNGKFSKLAVNYSSGMRATTDLGSRKRREEALFSLLADILNG